jgi:hypothetical protein
MHEEGLVRIYISKVQAIGVKALAGESFEEPINQIIAEAIEHIAEVKTSAPKDNFQAMAGQFDIEAEITSSTQPQYRATLEYASKLVHKHLDSL